MTLVDNEIHIHDLRVQGVAAEAAAAAIERGETATTVVLRMLDIGGAVLGHGAQKAAIDNVALEVDRFISTVSATVKDEVPAILAAESERMRRLLNEYFDPGQAESIQRQLDQILRSAAASQADRVVEHLRSQDGPLQIAKAELAGSIQILAQRQDEMLARVVALDERSRSKEQVQAVIDLSTTKGYKFEDSVETLLEHAARPHGDLVSNVSTTAGIDGNKKGDFVIEVSDTIAGGSRSRIVVEAKATKLSMNAAVTEIDAAISNRDSQAGILVFAGRDNAPLQGGSFRVLPERRILVATDTEDRDGLLLGVALQIARTLATLHAQARSGNLDATTVTEGLDRMIEALDSARVLRRGINAARRGIDQIESSYETLKVDISREVDGIRECLERDND